MAITVLDPFLDGKSSEDFGLVYAFCALVSHGVAIFYCIHYQVTHFQLFDMSSG